jgi:type II secretory pathway component GspD/PulD (secretin)
VLGALFRNKLQVNDRTELLVFITPKIVRDHLVDR